MMDEEQIIYWWERFCNSCMCEECKPCDIPVVDDFMILISPPSNYKNIEQGMI